MPRSAPSPRWFLAGFVLFLVLPAPAGAVSSVFKSGFRVYDSLIYPGQTVVTDLDGDGHLDIATVSEGFNDLIAVWLGNGDGTFQPADTTATTSGSGLAAGDMNEDTVPDLVAASGQVSIFIGQGDATFQLANLYSASTLHDELALADFDGDGHLDVVTAYGYAYAGGDSTITVRFGAGDGTVGAETVYHLPGVSVSLAPADLNGDTMPDLVATISVDTDSYSEQVGVMLNDGSGGLSAFVPYGSTVAGSVSSERGLSLADVDGDGKIDVLSGPRYLHGSGDGTLGTEVVFGDAGEYLPHAGDVNGDGIADLVTSVVYNLVVRLGTGGGSFGPAHVSATVVGPYDLDVADVNHDGRADVIATNSSAAAIGVHLSRGDGKFGLPNDIEIGAEAVASAVGDLNEDGRQDIAALAATGLVRIFPGLGAGQFGGSMLDLPVIAGPKAIALADLNGDGHGDIITVSNLPNTVSVYMSSGPATFGTRVDYGGPGSAIALAVGDLNGDARPDVVEGGGAGVAVYLTSPSGTLAPFAYYAGGSGSGRAVAIAEVTGDAYPDVIWMNRNDFVFRIFPGSATGALGTRQDVFHSSSTVYSALAVGDVDADGDNDLIAGGFANIRIARNDGGGVFTVQPLFRGEQYTQWLALGDVTGDGVPDLVSANLYPSCATVLAGLGGGVFAGGTFDKDPGYGTGAYAQHLVLADVDGDGALDAVVSNLEGETVSVLLNTHGLPVAVGPPAAAGMAFAIRRITPNPTRGPLDVSLALPVAAPVRLEVFDLQGRRVAVHEAGVLDPGLRTVAVDGIARLAPGLYWLSVTQGSSRAASRFVRLR